MHSPDKRQGLGWKRLGLGWKVAVRPELVMIKINDTSMKFFGLFFSMLSGNSQNVGTQFVLQRGT
jgi:hypothetical protein